MSPSKVSDEYLESQMSPTGVSDESLVNVTGVPDESQQSLRSVPTKSQMSSNKVSDESQGEALNLSSIEYQLYRWLTSRGLEGRFTPQEIISKTNMSKSSVFRGLKALEDFGILQTGRYSRRLGSKGYTIAQPHKIVCPSQYIEQSKVSDESQQSLSKVSDECQQSPSYKKERKILLINLSISDFWQSHGLTKQKLNSWVDELSFSEEEWNQQLQFGEHEPKVIHADNPIKYFYAALKKGGLTRPNGFEFPEERQARIAEENIKARQKALEKLNKIQQESEILAEQEAFNNFFEDKSAVEQALKEIEDGYLTPKGRNTIKVYREKGLMDKTLRTKLLTNFKSQK